MNSAIAILASYLSFIGGGAAAGCGGVRQACNHHRLSDTSFPTPYRHTFSTSRCTAAFVPIDQRNNSRKRRLNLKLEAAGVSGENEYHHLINLGELTEADRNELLSQLLIDADLVSDDNEPRKKPLDDGYQTQTLGRGFCNWVYRVDPLDAVSISSSSAQAQQSQSALVVKVFSDLAKVRVEEEILGSIDVLASDCDIGPSVLHRGPNGIVMQHVDGHVLIEEDVHGSIASDSSGPEDTGGRYGNGKNLCRCIAKRLAKLHTTQLPATLKANEVKNMLWYTLDAMLGFVGSDDPIPPAVLQAGWTYGALLEEVQAMKDAIQPLQLPRVLCHGDFKPSNIIVPTPSSSSEDGNEFEGIVLIDYELSGPGFRGFDFYKLFRTANKSGQCHDNMVEFVESYLCESMNCSNVPAHLVDNVLAEMKLFEPLTWLEAGIFFLFAAKGDPSDVEKWGKLVLDRLENYKRSKASFYANVEDYSERVVALR